MASFSSFMYKERKPHQRTGALENQKAICILSPRGAVRSWRDSGHTVFLFSGDNSSIKAASSALKKKWHKKEGSTETRYNMEELHKRDADWKKPDTEGHLLYGPIFLKCPDQANP